MIKTSRVKRYSAVTQKQTCHMSHSINNETRIVTIKQDVKCYNAKFGLNLKKFS